MRRHKKLIVIIAVFLCLGAGFTIWFFSGNPFIGKDGIKEISIQKLSDVGPPTTKTISNPDDIARFTELWDGISFYPVIQIANPSGTYAFLGFKADPYRYPIQINSKHRIQVGIRYFDTEEDLFTLINQFYHSVQ